MNTYTFHISGTHCASCKILIEDVLSNLETIDEVSVDLKKESIQIKTSHTYQEQELIDLVNSNIASHQYKVSFEKEISNTHNKSTTGYSIVLGFIILAIFFLLQKSGIVRVGLGGPITPVTSFIIGLIASVSSCLAVVGGLILSLSAKISQDNVSDTKTFTLFHISRIVSFALLGGVLGMVGGVLGINFTLSSILGIIASLIMLTLGLNLIGVIQKNKFVFSTRIFNFFKSIEHKTLTPVILGFATFFLPCGFTQSMQVASLSSGSFITGMYIMLAFALGTLPMLLVLSFGSATIARGRYAELFFKTVGVIVFGFGLFSLLAGLASLGIINPIITI